MNGRSQRAASMAALGLVAASALLAGCGEPSAVPMDDEYAGSGDESSSAASSAASSDASDSSSSAASGSESSSSKTDSGRYKDGTYAVKGEYGPVGEDTIDVSVTVSSGLVSDVQVVGHPFTTISKKHQDAFIKAIPGVVKGKALKTLKVDKVAGASWTSEAFNKALEVAREQASE
ncbi:MAG: FMN-binding protein [Bifidobacterium psychraerophilum]